MAERSHVEASLRSEFGLQRLTRAIHNRLSPVSLVPREPIALLQDLQVRWCRGAFALELVGPDVRAVFMQGRQLTDDHVLASGDRFRVGSTEIEFECTTRKWQVDVERERALLARDDAAAWSIYMDELLASGDPLGPMLAKTPQLDVAFELDVRPLLAHGEVSFGADPQGLWREVTFRREIDWGLEESVIEEGVIEAVLSSPIAWFAQRVRLELEPIDEIARAWFVRAARAGAGEIARFAGPHLEVVSLPDFPEGEPLPSPREGVRVER